MKDKLLIKFSLLVSFVGIIFLYFLFLQSSNNLINLDYNADSFLRENEGKKISFTGFVKAVNSNEKINTLNLILTYEINAVFFDKANFNTSYLLNQNISVEGSIEYFNGKKQIIVDKIFLN